MPKTIRITWSALKRYQKCSYAQKLVNEGKRSKSLDGRVFLLGNLVDNSMRRWLENEDFSVPIETHLRRIWEECTGPNAERPIKWKNQDDQAKIVEDARSSLVTLEETLREHVVPYRYEPEMRFTSTVGIPAPNGELIHLDIFGAIDVAILYDDETMGIFDLKTSKSRSYVSSSIGQLVLYDLAIRNYLGIKPVQHGFFTPMLKKESLIPVTVTDDDRRGMMSDIMTFAHGTWNNEWHLTENENDCYGCEVRHACIRWNKPLTGVQKKKNLMSFGKKK